MRRLILKKLIVISQSESKSLDVPFKAGLNIILGGNKTGKSSIIKSIFTAFGCECPKVESDWKQLISSYILFLSFLYKFHTIIPYLQVFRCQLYETPTSRYEMRQTR